MWQCQKEHGGCSLEHICIAPSDLRRHWFMIHFSTLFHSDAVTEVKTDIYVTSFGPVSDTDMVSIVPEKEKRKMIQWVKENKLPFSTAEP